MKTIRAICSVIITTFVALLLWGAIQNSPEALKYIVPGVLIGLVWAFLTRDSEDDETRRIRQEAAKQERQARLIADAIAEREARQQLGEFSN